MTEQSITPREIRFRAFDLHFNEMCYVTSMFWPFKKKNGFDIVEGHGVTGTPYRDITLTESNPLMQFTGLKDKNGKEIYEGDRMNVLLPDGGFWGDERKQKIGVVKYESDYGGFIVQWEYSKNQHHIELGCDVAIEGEIIGNIFQPELISSPLNQ